jgi:uncharacterized protein YjbI with pentapeptide repeats
MSTRKTYQFPFGSNMVLPVISRTPSYAGVSPRILHVPPELGSVSPQLCEVPPREPSVPPVTDFHESTATLFGRGKAIFVESLKGVMKMNKKVRTIHTPDLPEDLEFIAINEVDDGSSFEMGKIESTIGNINAKNVRFSEVHIKNVNFEESQLPYSSWADVVFEKCDLSNVKLNGARFNRVAFKECKLTGVDFDETVMQDVQFIDCPAPYSLFSLTDLRDVHFDNCLLKEANFIEAKLDNVQLGTSNIEEVQFSDTSLMDVDLSRCEFTFIHIKENDLRGAIISPHQAVTFIELFGLKVKDV